MSRKKEKHDNVKIRETIYTIITIVIIVLVYAFFFWIESFIRPSIEEYFTTAIQKELMVRTTIQQVDVELIENYDSYSADYYIKPLSFAVSVTIVVILSAGVIATVYLVIKRNKRINRKFNIRFNTKMLYICKWIIEFFVLLCGVFIAVYGYAKIDARKYGIDKYKIQQDTKYRYYLVEDIPFTVNYLEIDKTNVDNNDSEEDKRLLMTGISDSFDEICLCVALLGCFVFSLNFIIDYEESFCDSDKNQDELCDLIYDVILERKINSEIKRDISNDLIVEIRKAFNEFENKEEKRINKLIQGVKKNKIGQSFKGRD